MPISVPPGFRFLPTDSELLSYYLERKERGSPIPSDRITEKQVYGTTPWKVFGEDEPWNECDGSKKKTMIFVFSKLSKVGNSNKKTCRVAGCGTWEGKSVPQNVRNSEGKIIGKKRAFTFKPHKGFESEMKGKGHWIMHEMSVVGYNYVVCRITRDLSKGFPNHEKKEEEEISTVGKGLNYQDDQQESYRKRKLADRIEDEEKEEDSPHGKKLCGRGDSSIPPVQQTDDLIDISFLFDDFDRGYEEGIIPSVQQTELPILFDDHHYEEICAADTCFANAERFLPYVQNFENCIR